jgi:hypothetical protein
MDAVNTAPVKNVSDQLRRLIDCYGTPARAAAATGLPENYFRRLRGTHRHRDTVAAHYTRLLSRAIAELNGVFEIRLSLESRAIAKAMAKARDISVRELAEDWLEQLIKTADSKE